MVKENILPINQKNSNFERTYDSDNKLSCKSNSKECHKESSKDISNEYTLECIGVINFIETIDAKVNDSI